MRIKNIISILLAIIIIMSCSVLVVADDMEKHSNTNVLNSDKYPLLSYKVVSKRNYLNANLKFGNLDTDTNYYMVIDDSSPFFFYSEDGEVSVRHYFKGENVNIYLDVNLNLAYGQVNPLSFSLYNSQSNECIGNYYVPVDINAKNDEPIDEKPDSTLTPHLFITGYNISEEAISAGEDFKLTINFKNTSKTEDIENVIMTYSLPAGMALAKASTNFYFPKVAKDSTSSQTVTITSDGSLADGLQNIGIAFSYEYKNESDVYTQGTDSETLSVKVGATASEEQADRFEISSIDLPDTVYLGQEEYITVNLINKGSKALNNVSAKINSENISNNGYNEYLGQVAANSKGEIELVINPSTAGDVIGTITVSYEHEDGTVVETTRDFTVFCEDPNAWMDDPGIYDPGAFDEPIVEKNFPVWGYVLIGVGAVAVVVAAIVITKKVIKNKKEKALEEELDEDI